MTVEPPELPTGQDEAMPRRQVARTVRQALRHRASRSALLALLCFRTTELATWVALLVWAYQQRGATGTGIIALAQLVPATLVAPLASVTGDRISHRRALIAGFLAQTTGCVVTWIALSSDASFAVVCLCAAFLASSLSLTRPVYYATVPGIVDEPGEATALNSVSVGVEGFSDFLGPAVAAVLLATHGASWVLLVMAFASMVAVVAAMTLPEPRTGDDEASDAYLALFNSGIATLVNDRSAALLTLLVGVGYVVIGMLDILGVVLAFDILRTNQAGPGLLTAALGVGAVIGAATTVILIGRQHLAPAVVIGACVAGLPVAAASISSTLWEALLLFAVAGAGVAFLEVATRTLTQRVIAPEILSRVFGLQEAMLLGGTAVGTFFATALVAIVGPRWAFVIGGLVLPIAAFAVWPWIRRLDSRSKLPGASFTLLRGIPMFAVLPQARLELLARQLEEVEIDAGQPVVVQGDPGDRFYVIADGTARVLVDGEPRRTLDAGDGFGEIALLHDVRRTATVEATSDLRLEALDRDTFLSVVTGSARSHEAGRRSADEFLRPPRIELEAPPRIEHDAPPQVVHEATPGIVNDDDPNPDVDGPTG